MRTCIRALLTGAIIAQLGAATSGCQIEILRSRAGRPIQKEKLVELEEGKTTRAEAVEKLGPPEKVEWKSGKDYFWYLHKDKVDTGIRFQFPPFRTIFDYQHTFLRLNEVAEDTSAMELVFREDGVLERKSLRLSDADKPPREDHSNWKLHLSAEGEYSLLLLGDGGVAAYDKIFKPGYKVAVGAGWQPMPVVTLFGRGTYQEHQGDSTRRQGRDLSFSDLHLYGFELGVRLAAPLELLWGFTDFENVKRVLFEDDLSRSTGFRFFLEGTTGIQLNSNVTVKIDGVRAGNFYDNAHQLSGSVGAGLEYGWKWGAAHVGIAYETLDPFNEGNTTLDDRGGAFQAVLLGGGLSLKF